MSPCFNTEAGKKRKNKIGTRKHEKTKTIPDKKYNTYIEKAQKNKSLKLETKTRIRKKRGKKARNKIPGMTHPPTIKRHGKRKESKKRGIPLAREAVSRQPNDRQLSHRFPLALPAVFVSLAVNPSSCGNGQAAATAHTTAGQHHYCH